MALFEKNKKKKKSKRGIVSYFSYDVIISSIKDNYLTSQKIIITKKSTFHRI